MSEAASWIEEVKSFEEALEPAKQRAIDLGVEPGVASYLASSAAMQRMVFTHNNRRRLAAGMEMPAYASFEEFVLKHGEVFEAPPEKQPRPKGFRKGRDKGCFRNSVYAVFEHDDWQYVEGYGVGMIPAHHAWVLDTEGRVVETTWKTSGSTYFGVQFSEEEWRLTMSLTNVFGVFNEVLMEQPYTPEGYVAALRAALAEKRKVRVHA